MERQFLSYVTKEEQFEDMRDKVTLPMLDELRDNFHKLQTVNVTMEENLQQKLTNLRDELQDKTKEMLGQIGDLNKKMDEIEEEGSDYDDEESDLGSELEDTLDVDDVGRGRDNHYEKDRKSDEDDLEGDATKKSKQYKSEASKDHNSESESGVEDESNLKDKDGANSSTKHPMTPLVGNKSGDTTH